MSTNSDGEKIILSAGRRLAIVKSNSIENWYFSYSPRNDNTHAEGTWEEWVELAKEILKRNKVSQ